MTARRLLGWTNLLFGGVLMLAVWMLLVLVASRPGIKRVFDLSPGARFTVDPASQTLLAELAAQGKKVEFHVFFQALDAEHPPQDAFQRQRWTILRSLQGLTYDLLTSYQSMGKGAVRAIYHSQGDIAGYREASEKYNVGNGDWVVVEVLMPNAPPRSKRLNMIADLAAIETPGAQPGQPGVARNEMPVLKDYKGEEAISSGIKSLLVQGTPVLYVARGYGMDVDMLQATNQGAGYGLLWKSLESEGFQVRMTDLSRGVPDDATAVAVIEPRQELPGPVAQALLAYVRRGGRLLLNYSYASVETWNPDGGELGQALGFRIGPDPVFHLIQNPNNPTGPGLDRNRDVQRLPVVLNPQHPVTQPLVVSGRFLQLTQARSIELRKDAEGLRRDGLLQTGPFAWVAARPQDRTSFARPVDDRALQPRDAGIAIELDGKDKAGNAVTGLVVVLAGVLCNNEQLAINRDFGLNVFQWFADRKELVTVHGERYQAKRFQFGLEQLARVQWLLILVVPLLFLGLGILVAYRRSRP